MSLADRLGVAGLIVGLMGICSVYLWPERRSIGWLALVVAVGLVIGWATLEIERKFGPGRLALLRSPAIGALLGAAIAAAAIWFWVSTTRGPSTAAIIAHLATFIEEGSQIQARFLASNDAKKELEEGNDWATRVNKYLTDSLNGSYAVQFRDAQGSAWMGVPANHSIEGGGYWQNIEGKKRCLSDFIVELRQPRHQ